MECVFCSGAKPGPACFPVITFSCSRSPDLPGLPGEAAQKRLSEGIASEACEGNLDSRKDSSPPEKGKDDKGSHCPLVREFLQSRDQEWEVRAELGCEDRAEGWVTPSQKVRD